MACESRQLHCLAPGFNRQHQHSMPGAEAAAPLLSRQQHICRNEIRLLRNRGGSGSQHNCQLTCSICVSVCGFAKPFKGLLRAIKKHLWHLEDNGPWKLKKKKKRTKGWSSKGFKSIFFFLLFNLSLFYGTSIQNKQKSLFCCHIHSYTKSISDCFQDTSSPAKHNPFYRLGKRGKGQIAQQKKKKSTL